MRRAPLAALAATALLLVACDNASVRTEVDTRKITYSRDDRTGLCFATLGRGESWVGFRAASFSMTAVPCSEQVLRLIGR
jgi:hypothetical protein